MSKKQNQELAKATKLRDAFKQIAAGYPFGGYDKAVDQLEQQRVDLVNKIGRKRADGLVRNTNDPALKSKKLKDHRKLVYAGKHRQGEPHEHQ